MVPTPDDRIGSPEGWYEAIVVEANGDMLTTRWRDYPRERRMVHHRLRLGLLYPGPRPNAENGKSTKASGQTKREKPVAVDPTTNHSLPKDWDEIDINHLVLASRSRRPATCLSCAGARNMRPMLD